MELIYIRLTILIVALISTFIWKVSKEREKGGLSQIVLSLFALYSIANISFLVYIWINHNIIYHVVLVEGSSLAEIHRAMNGQVFFTKPSAQFIPFAYQPLYYYIVAFIAKIFGLNFSMARLVSILATTGSLIIVFAAVWKETKSLWWSVLAAGLFAAAYSIFDNTLEGIHPDSWLLFTVLLGCYLINRKASVVRNTFGLLLTILAFWFKQHGAIFAFAALIYLSWQENWKNVWFYWVLTILLGPVLYFATPDSAFGSYYHYYTWEVPRHWTEFNFSTIRHFGGFILKSYPVLSILSVGATVFYLLKTRITENIWYFMFPFALASGFLGALDPGSSNNVFILMGVWFIIVGTLALKDLVERFPLFNLYGFQWLILGITFAAFAYNPAAVIISPRVTLAYGDLVNYVDSLDGPVYAPWVGQLPETTNFYPAANWIALEDIIRGPGVDEQNHPVAREVLDPLIHPKGNAYILMNYPLENDSMLGFLKQYYVLDQDLGDRFALLGPINPARWNLMWPRYLYKYSLQK